MGGERRGEANVYIVEMTIIVSPCSVASFRLLTTPFKTHSLVGVPPEDEDCTDSVEGGGKGRAHELHINMLHSMSVK